MTVISQLGYCSRASLPGFISLSFSLDSYGERRTLEPVRLISCSQARDFCNIPNTNMHSKDYIGSQRTIDAAEGGYTRIRWLRY